MSRFHTFTLALLLFSLPLSVSAQTLKSGQGQVTLIELYTSEGCSSCPPAEEYLNSLKNHPQLWQRFIPLALHVDYWDYLGWRDQFASSTHTQRQRQYARVNAQNTIYTPGFFVDGRPWRPGLFGGLPAQSQRMPGELSLTIEKGAVHGLFKPGATSSGSATLNLTLAVLGMGFHSDIGAGENHGRNAQHDFVLLKHQQLQSKTNEWRLSLPDVKDRAAARLALVAWVSEPGSPVPLQAVGGYLE